MVPAGATLRLMLAHAFTYAEAVISYWFTGFWFLTAVPEALSYVLLDTTFEMAGKRLDSWVTHPTRRKIYALLAVFGFVVAAFLAWEEQYEKTQMDWEVLSSTEMTTWAQGLSAFKVPVVTIWYVPRDEDVAVTVAKALQDARWHVVEIRESNPIVGFSIDASKDVTSAAEALQTLCEKKFGLRPEIGPGVRDHGSLDLTIGRRVP